MKSDEIIEYYFNNYKYFDINIIREIINIIINEEELNEYVDNIIIGNGNKKNLAFFFPSTKTLQFNTNSINYHFYLKYRDTGLPYDEKIISKYYNAYYLHIIYHEIEHVKQYRDSFKTNDDSLTIIIKEGIELGKRSPNNLNLNEKMLYELFYLNILTERNAECNALLKMYLKNIDLNILTNYNKNEIIKKIIKLYNKGYSKNNCPVKIYYNLRNKVNEYRNISFNEDYDNITKLSWGLPINDILYEDLLKSKKDNDLKKLIR